jgi:hypothetical protein
MHALLVLAVCSLLDLAAKVSRTGRYLNESTQDEAKSKRPSEHNNAVPKQSFETWSPLLNWQTTAHLWPIRMQFTIMVHGASSLCW